MPIEEYTPIIGKNLLDSLILKLYSESLSIYREYIQNACDSIYDAVNNGILESVDKGCVAITISPYLKKVSIRDNGTGIAKDKAVSTLMDIYHGNKDGISSAGQYGIGRLSGGGYCRKLIFATSAKGETIETRVTIDVEQLRVILLDDSDDRSAEEIMKTICSVDYRTAIANDHYMDVILEDVFLHQEKILDKDVVKKYVQLVAPIDYSVSFKKMMQCSFGNALLDESRKIRHINVSINDDFDIKKEYGYEIKSTGDSIDSLRLFEVEDRNYGELAWGWYAVTPFSVAIPDSDLMRGIQLRKHNIALDRSYVDKLFNEARGNSYFYGEIFISSDYIVPNSNRDGLAPSAEAEALSECLRKYFKTLKGVYTVASQLKNALKKICDSMNCFYGTNFKTELERKSVVSDVEKYKKEFLAKTENSVKEKNDVGNIYLRKYKEEVFRDGKTIECCVNEIIESNSGRDNEEKNVNADVKLVQSETEQNDTPITKDSSYSVQIEKPVASKKTPSELEDETSTSKITEEPQRTLTTAKDYVDKRPIFTDVYQELENCGYDQVAIDAIRKAYAFIMVSCPKHMKGEMKEIINKAIGLLKDN